MFHNHILVNKKEQIHGVWLGLYWFVFPTKKIEIIHKVTLIFEFYSVECILKSYKIFSSSQHTCNEAVWNNFEFHYVLLTQTHTGNKICNG